MDWRPVPASPCLTLPHPASRTLKLKLVLGNPLISVGEVGLVEQEACRVSYFPGTSKWEQGGLEPNGRAEETQETPPVQGSLLFSVFYDQTQSRLVLTVLEARGLPTRDFSHSVDPFVRVRLLWEGRPPPPLRCVLHEWQTHIVKNSDSPIFRDQFSCSLAEDEVSRVTVRLEVRDFDKYSRHGILGEVRVPLSGLSIAYPLEILENLQEPKKDQVGEVLLSLKFLPTSQRLEVGLLKIRMLSVCSTKDKAMYARICVLCNQRKIRHQRTTLKTRRDVTVFNEVMTFVLPDLQVTDCSVILSFYEVCTSRRSSKQMIGQVALGNGCGSEDEHWNLMMRSLRQPIAKWHFVLI